MNYLLIMSVFIPSIVYAAPNASSCKAHLKNPKSKFYTYCVELTNPEVSTPPAVMPPQASNPGGTPPAQVGPELPDTSEVVNNINKEVQLPPNNDLAPVSNNIIKKKTASFEDLNLNSNALNREIIEAAQQNKIQTNLLQNSNGNLSVISPKDIERLRLENLLDASGNITSKGKKSGLILTTEYIKSQLPPKKDLIHKNKKK